MSEAQTLAYEPPRIDVAPVVDDLVQPAPANDQRIQIATPICEQFVSGC